MNQFVMSNAAWLWLASLLIAIIALLIAVAALAWDFWLQRYLRKVNAEYKALVAGTSGGNLEQILNEHIATVHDTVSRLEELETLARQTDLASRRSLQWLGVLRFNPFNDVGGDQSFALALVDGYGNGVVVSSLHMRDVTRVYAKPLKKWEAEHHLTDEEKQAIANAYAMQSQARKKTEEGV
ncbi:MAG: DUF4446 family protein [Anaerolineae bacterium]